MIPWELLDSVATPGDQGQMSLHRRGQEYAIRIDGLDLMNSRMHGSEEVISELACAAMPTRSAAPGRPPCLLIGGLGMGFTLAAAIRSLPADAEIVVAELVSAVIAWNRGVLGHLAGHPLADRRVRIHEGDVRPLLVGAREQYDAIVLDVDNGPEGLSQSGNGWLYGRAGLAQAATALRPGGVLSVWSARGDDRFTERLRKAGFVTRVHRVTARTGGGGPRHSIWVARRSA